MEKKTKSPGASPEKKKSTQKKFRDSGVKRLIILGLIEDAPETYHNVKLLMDLCGVNSLSFAVSFCCDLKMSNIACGENLVYFFVCLN